MQNELETYIQSYFGIAGANARQVSSFFREMQFRKNDYYLKADAYSDKLGFIQSGIMRKFLYVDGREVTKWISTPGYFVADLSGFLFNQPARWNIQALTDCTVYVLNKQDYAQIGRLIPQWQQLEKLFLARCFTILEDRVVVHLSQTAEERYTRFFNFAPDLFNQVPLQYLASLLGMTPETFSRIRKKQAGRTS